MLPVRRDIQFRLDGSRICDGYPGDRKISHFYNALSIFGRGAGRLRGWGELIAFLYGPKRGLFPKLLRPWLDYFRPAFHPWDHDNRRFLEQVDEILATARTPTLPAAA